MQNKIDFQITVSVDYVIRQAKESLDLRLPRLKRYYDQKNHLFFLRISKLCLLNTPQAKFLALIWEQDYLVKLQFSHLKSAITTPEKIEGRHSLTSFRMQSVWTQLTDYAKHEFESLKTQNSRAAY